MAEDFSSMKPIEGANRSLRRRLTLRQEFVLALLPTATILAVFAFVEVLTSQRLLFASLASSAFLIYLDPQHGTNAVRTLVASQMLAAVTGWATFLLFDAGYAAGGTALILTIVLMILLDIVHPPAVATALAFAFRAGDASNLLLFGLTVGATASLVVMEQLTLRILARMSRG